jgi:hypothetical protein
MSVARGWDGEGERRSKLCVMAAATLCHEMSQIVMYLGLLRWLSTVSFSMWCLIVFITPVKYMKSLVAGLL